MAVGWMAGQLVPPERIGLNRWVWIALLFVVTSIMATGLRKGLHRLAPLATLMELTLVFPDQAPSRSKTVLRKSSSRTMLRQIEEARANGDSTGEVIHGAYLVQLLTEVNAHDRLTRGHSERVRSYAEMLGEQLGLGEDDMNKLRWSALLHDVGKLDVPAEIINKNGRPTDDEWAVLTEHPSAGRSMLEPLSDWLGDWIHAADQHHCRWDGNGYPLDLAGNDIALAGRIVAVADAYDVMTSARSYKKPLPAQVARRELTDCAGSQFDPAIVRAFLNISLGRLRAVAGPLASLANVLSLPQVRIPVISTVGSVSGPALTAMAAVGIVSLGGMEPEPVPEALAMEAPLVVYDAEVDGLEDESVEITLRAEGGTGTVSFRLSTPAHGEVTPPVADGLRDQGDGWELSVTYTPTPDFYGSDQFVYEACDLDIDIDIDSGCESAVVQIAVDGVNDAPQANDDWATAEPDQSVSLDVLANDIDVDGDQLEIVEVGDPGHGLVTVAEGRVVYLPEQGHSGADTIDYTIADPSGARSTATAHIEVGPQPELPPPDVNVPPTAEPDLAFVAEDTAVVIDVLANDSDEDGDSISIVGIEAASRGTVVIDNGQVRYQPDTNTNGTDTFLYLISDGVNPAVAATATVVVSPVNDAPIATSPTAVSIGETAPIGSVVLAIVASDPDVDPLAFSLSAGDPSSRFAVNSDGKVMVAAPLDHETTPSFNLEIEVSDGSTLVTVTPTVIVIDVNEAPVAVNDTGPGFTTNEDTPFTTGSVLANDFDVDDVVDPASITVASNPGHGALVDNGDGTFGYNPDPGWSGIDAFTYTITDSQSLVSSQATVAITVNAVNDAPNVTNPGPQAGAEGTPLVLQITAVDDELDTLTYGAVGLPAGLIISGTGLISGTPDPATQGSHSVDITVTDDGLPSASTTITFSLDLAFHQASSQAGVIVVNEVLYNTVSVTAPEEFVELHNQSGSAIDLTGWVLTDANLKADGAEDLSFTLPATDHWGSPSTLGAGEYAVVWVVYDGVNLPPLLNAGAGLEYVVNVPGLKLGGSGDDLWLLDPETRLVDYVAYGGGGEVGTPPEAGLSLWDATFQASLLTASAESILLTPDGVDGNTSGCWEPAASNDANGRCPGALATVDSDTMGLLATSVGLHNNVAANAGGTYAIAEGVAVGLDGSSSTGATTFAWDLDNDGSYDDASGVSPSVPWATLVSIGVDDDGVYPVGLEVDGGVARATTTLTISNVVPTLSTTGAATVSDGGVYTLTLGDSDPGDDTITSWTINWGDGTIETIAGNPTSVTHTYTGQGFTFDILASATDEDGTYLLNELLVPSFTGDEVFRFAPTTGSFLQRFGVADDPIEALIGPDGRLYVSGDVSNNVMRYDAQTGAFVDEFVAAASGGLDSAQGLAFGADGHLYVGGWVGDRVMRYDGTSGAFIDVFASGTMNGPYDVLFGPDSNLYVTSYISDEVIRFDGTTGAFMDVFVAAGSGGLDSPEQAVFGPDGNLYVASYDSGQIIRFDGTTGAFIDVFVATGGAGDLDQPSGLAFGPDGHLYVADYMDDVILRFDGTIGTFIDEYVSPGAGGLTDPALITFLADQQVTVTP
ncbi:MAG: tandem-95 repeat protein [Actinomycetia bacterium]|nr:tandem-95 repeat protein [Actinomycetes bacterium]